MSVSQDFLKRWYDTEAQRNDQTVMYRTPWARKRYNTIKSLLLPVIPNSVVLDVGCGRGMYSLWMAQNGARHVQGLDISEVNIENAESDAGNLGNVTFFCDSWDGDNDWLRYVDFDVVLATEVFEHAISPEYLVSKCEGWGKLIIASAPINDPVHDQPFEVQGHLHEFTPVSFASLFHDAKRILTDDHYVYVIATGRE